MEFKVSSRTDTGRSRSNNEDALLADPPLIAVADGMGGHAFGEVAASVALEAITTFKERLDGLSGLEAASRLEEAVAHANETVFKKGQDDKELAGMGTTLTAGWVSDSTLSIAHVGDSRAYLLRGNKLQQLTEDQNVVGELVRRGRISADEAASDPRRHIVTQAIGIDSDVLDVETASVPLRPGDRILFATDGLFGMVRDDEAMRDLLIEHPDGDEACEALIDAANAAGGQDNITVVIVDVEGDPAAAGVEVDEPVQIDRGPVSPATPPTSVASRAREPGDPGTGPRSPKRLALVIGGALLLVAVMAAVVLLRPSGPNYVVAAQRDDVVLLDGSMGSGGEPAEGKVVRRFRQQVDDFAEPTQRQLEIGFEVASMREAEDLVEGLPRKLGPQDTATPEPKESTSPKPTATAGAKESVAP
jgi:protein phosphatase